VPRSALSTRSKPFGAEQAPTFERRSSISFPPAILRAIEEQVLRRDPVRQLVAPVDDQARDGVPRRDERRRRLDDPRLQSAGRGETSRRWRV
jgi:hypothetical protein